MLCSQAEFLVNRSSSNDATSWGQLVEFSDELLEGSSSVSDDSVVKTLEKTIGMYRENSRHRIGVVQV